MLAGFTPSGGGNAKALFRVVVKPSDTTITADNSLNNDADLTLTVEANKRYAGHAILIYVSPAAADIQFAFSIPSGAAGRKNVSNLTAAGTPGGTDDIAGNVVHATSDGNTLMTAYAFHIITGGTAGSLTLQWAQNTSDAGNTTLLAGSYIMLAEIT